MFFFQETFYFCNPSNCFDLKKHCNNIFLLVFTIVSIAASAQEEEIKSDTSSVSTASAVETPLRPKKYYLFSPRLSITVPHPINNGAFKRTFVGLYELNAGMNVLLYKGIFAGAVFKNSELQITPNKIPGYDASMNFYSFAFKAGSDFYANDKNSIIISASIAAGQNNTKFTSLKTKLASEHPVTAFKSTYIEPELDMFFMIEPDFGIGATITYSSIKRNFDPYELYLNEWAPYERSNPGSTQYLTFGFGFYYGFGKRNFK